MRKVNTDDSALDLTLYVVADNPFGESCHYPDSKKWIVLARAPADPVRPAGLLRR